ncbi:MAG: hypothetical protein DCC67_10075 [Planctomycetota bacterium]|nr:MAG: hypothetical protein DCC67_10075 [Planctomycetota bacterium]
MGGMSDSPRRWYRLRLRTLVLLTLAATVAWSVYSYWSDYQEQAARRERELLSPPRGATCTVVFRRELIGLGQMGPTPATVNGIDNSVRGRFMLMNDDWIVLAGQSDNDSRQHWIPRGNVLVLEVDASR